MMERFKFDSFLFPINWVCWYQSNFGPGVGEKAQEKGLAILALKSLAKRKLGKNESKKCWYAPVDNKHEATWLCVSLYHSPL